MDNKIVRLIIVFFFFGFIVKVSAGNGQEGTGETDGYKLVWQDLFDGGILDEEHNWSVEVNGDGGGNRELQYYRRENIVIGAEPFSGNGCLILTAKKENYKNKTATSGRLTTQNRMSFTHGKIEARIKLPKTANGLWPAFWLLGNTVTTESWPRCGEIDILEMGHGDGIRNNTQDRYFNGACHWGFYEGQGYPNYAKASTNPYGLQDDFHLYTMIWDDDKIAMYLDMDKNSDAEPYYIMNISDKSSAQSPGNYLHRKFFVIFNLAVGGNFPQIWNINQVTALSENEAKMYVDYVKVYQKGNDNDEFSWIGSSSSTIDDSRVVGKPCISYSSSNREIAVEGEVEYLSVLSSYGTAICYKTNINRLQLPLGLASGIYILTVKMRDNNLFTYKISL